MNIIGIIPSRFGSTRLPGKPLKIIQGKSMIQRVFEQAQKSKSLSKVVVATDDDRNFAHVISFGGNVVMTSTDHPSGTDRCYEAYTKVGEEFDAVINIQGDEPFIHPEQIDELSQCISNANSQIGTLIKLTEDSEEIDNENVPKVVFNGQNEALNFTRETVSNSVNGQEVYYKHIGIYGYKSSVLKELVTLKPSKREIENRLEQLRWLDNNYTINIAITTYESAGIDTQKDLDKFS